MVHFQADGERLLAAMVGTGATGVVLANQRDNSVCQWLPLPSFLAGHGMRVLAFDYGSRDFSLEVQAAAGFLRDQGSTRIVLIGASIGGAVVIDAGVHMHPKPAAVICLSAVPEATGYSFLADAKRLISPTFQIGSTDDTATQEGKDTRTLFRESPSHAKRLLLIPGESAHGTDFTADNRVVNAMLNFITTHALS